MFVHANLLETLHPLLETKLQIYLTRYILYLDVFSCNFTVDSFAIDLICNCSRRPPPRRPLTNDVGGAIANESTVLETLNPFLARALPM